MVEPSVKIIPLRSVRLGEHPSCTGDVLVVVNQGDSDECVYRISPEDLDSTGEMFVLAAQHLIAQNIDTDDEVCGA